MKTIRGCWRNTKEMPFLLRILCQGGMVAGPLLLVTLVVPAGNWKFNGHQMSYPELWRSGTGIIQLIFLGLVTLGTWGIAARKPSSRWALVVAPILPPMLALAFPGLRATMSLDVSFFLL